ncbi:glycosyltransferase [Fictibacillus nanhaiensis]|uniref:glycosyltransferase family 2 protein n=1 Tax=Fictibacillus nanhaiensis TaxID=742169 RepID=UPI001C93DCC4|nr:glycosyltransferase [Fictibacillus nanhaiensis]MBY6036287.1 glycosyltransferase [Fictibacillus nanhaiensis]
MKKKTYGPFQNKKKKISVILPTYNKGIELLLTLYSLNNQTFPKSDYEVIVVDDGSVDGTNMMINNHTFQFCLHYIESEQNIGRSKIRNLGIEHATGDIIIFLDAEILVNPDFVFQHYVKQIEKDKRVVSGSMVLSGIYTIYHPEFNQKQLDSFHALIQTYPNSAIQTWIKHKGVKPAQLIKSDQIIDQSFKKLTFPKPHVAIYREKLFDVFGNELKGFHFPWLLFCTGNVSIKREAFDKYGLFDEAFSGYGWEDIELGYRLYKKGYTFLNHEPLVAYHQEHPVQESNGQQAVQNFLRVFRKYHELQLRVFILHYLEIDTVNVHHIYHSFLKVIERFPGSYKEVKTAFPHAINQLAVNIQSNKQHPLLTGYPGKKDVVLKQLEELTLIKDTSVFAKNFKNILNT